MTGSQVFFLEIIVQNMSWHNSYISLKENPACWVTILPYYHHHCLEQLSDFWNWAFVFQTLCFSLLKKMKKDLALIKASLKILCPCLTWIHLSKVLLKQLLVHLDDNHLRWYTNRLIKPIIAPRLFSSMANNCDNVCCHFSIYRPILTQFIHKL